MAGLGIEPGTRASLIRRNLSLSLSLSLYIYIYISLSLSRSLHFPSFSLDPIFFSHHNPVTLAFAQKREEYIYEIKQFHFITNMQYDYILAQ